MENNEEVPVNQGARFEINEFEEKKQQDFSHIPVLKRVLDKNWKIRLSAYQELTLLFQSPEGKDSQDFKDIKNLPKCLIETNPTALENAILMIQAYLKIGGEIEIDETVKNAIEKGIAQMKTQEKRLNLFDLVQNAFDKIKENQETRQKFHDALNIQIGSKIPKNSTAAIQLLILTLQNFGVQYLDLLKPYFKIIKKMAESTVDQRKEAIILYQEAYKQLGDSLSAFISDLKKQQLDELEKFFTSYKESGEVFHPHRLPIKKVSDEPKKKVEAYDLADALDVFKSFDDNWCSKTVAIEKWQDRLQAVLNLTDAVGVPKISDTSNFMPVLGMIKKILKMDGNINVQKQSIKAIGNICRGLRKPFEKGAKALFPQLLDKLKDKKTIEDTQNCLINYPYSIQIQQLQEPILTALQDKNPTMKIQIMLWVQKLIEDQIEIPDKVQFLAATLEKLVKDSDKNVRAQTLKLQSLIQQGESDPQETPDFKKTAKAEPSKQSAKNELIKIDETPKKQPINKEKQSTQKVIVESQKKENKTQVNNFLTIEEAVSTCQEKGINEKFLTQIQEDKNVAKSISFLKDDAMLPKIYKCVDQVLFIFKEKYKKLLTTLQINKELMRVIQIISETTLLSTFGFNFIQFILIFNLGDPKFTQSINQIIQSQLNLAQDSKFMIQTIITKILDPNQKCGPKTYNEFTIIFTSLLQVNPSISLPFKEIDNLCKILLDNKNANIRSLANTIISNIIDYKGEENLTQLKKCGPVYQQQNQKNTSVLNKSTNKSLLDNSMQKSKANFQSTGRYNSNQSKATPDKKMLGKSQIMGSILTEVEDKPNELSQSMVAKNAKKVDMNVLTQKLGDKNNGSRQEGVNMLIEAVENQSLPSTNMTQLITIMTQRILDANKPLQKQFIAFLPKFVENYYKYIKTLQKNIIENLIQTLTDKNLKKISIQVIDQIQSKFGVEVVLNYLIVGLKNENVESRKEIIMHLKTYKANLVKCDQKKLIENTLNVLTDKSADIRSLGEDLVLYLISVIGEKEFQLVVRTKTKTFQEMFKNLASKQTYEVQDNTSMVANEKNVLSNSYNQQTQSFDSSNLNLSQEMKPDYSEWNDAKLLRFKQMEKTPLIQQIKEQGLIFHPEYRDFYLKISKMLQKNSNNLFKYSDLILRQAYHYVQSITDKQEFLSIFQIINKFLTYVKNEKAQLLQDEISIIFQIFKIYIGSHQEVSDDIYDIFRHLIVLRDKRDIYNQIHELINMNESSFKPILSLILKLFPQKFSTHFESLMRYFKGTKRNTQIDQLIKLWGTLFPKMLHEFSLMNPNTKIREIVEVLYFLDDIASIENTLLSNFSNDLVSSFVILLLNLKKIVGSNFNVNQFLDYLFNFIHKMVTLQLCTKNLEPNIIQKFLPLLNEQCIVRLIEVMNFQQLKLIKPINDQIDTKIAEKIRSYTQINQEVTEEEDLSTINVDQCFEELNSNLNWEENIEKLHKIKQQCNNDFSNELKRYNDVFQCYFISYMFHYEHGLIVKPEKTQPVKQQNIIQNSLTTKMRSIAKQKLQEKDMDFQCYEEEVYIKRASIKSHRSSFKNSEELNDFQPLRTSQEIFSLSLGLNDNLLFEPKKNIATKDNQDKIDEIIGQFVPTTSLDEIAKGQETKIDQLVQQYSKKNKQKSKLQRLTQVTQPESEKIESNDQANYYSFGQGLNQLNFASPKNDLEFKGFFPNEKSPNSGKSPNFGNNFLFNQEQQQNDCLQSQINKLEQNQMISIQEEDNLNSITNFSESVEQQYPLKDSKQGSQNFLQLKYQPLIIQEFDQPMIQIKESKENSQYSLKSSKQNSDRKSLNSKNISPSNQQNVRNSDQKSENKQSKYKISSDADKSIILEVENQRASQIKSQNSQFQSKELSHKTSFCDDISLKSGDEIQQISQNQENQEKEINQKSNEKWSNKLDFYVKNGKSQKSSIKSSRKNSEHQQLSQISSRKNSINKSRNSNENSLSKSLSQTRQNMKIQQKQNEEIETNVVQKQLSNYNSQNEQSFQKKIQKELDQNYHTAEKKQEYNSVDIMTPNKDISIDNLTPSKKENYKNVYLNIRQSFKNIHSHQQFIDEKLQKLKTKNDQQSYKSQSDQKCYDSAKQKSNEIMMKYKIQSNEKDNDQNTKFLFNFRFDETCDSLINTKNEMMNNYIQNRNSIQESIQQSLEIMKQSLTQEELEDKKKDQVE